MGMYALLFMGTTPIGSLFVGTLAEHNGVRAEEGVPRMVMEMAAVCAVGVLVAVWFAARKRRRPAEAVPLEEARPG